MTELPDCLGQNIGLAARTFRAHAGPDMSDRTMWTDSPADRARKEKVSTRLYMYQLLVLMHLTSIFFAWNTCLFSLCIWSKMGNLKQNQKCIPVILQNYLPLCILFFWSPKQIIIDVSGLWLTMLWLLILLVCIIVHLFIGWFPIYGIFINLCFYRFNVLCNLLIL